MARPGLSHRAVVLALAASLATAVPLAVAPAPGLELQGRTAFTRPPWKVDLVSYHTTVGQPWAEYYFTVELPAGAGAALGELSIQQTRGVDRHFDFNVEHTRAFLGRPRREGAAVPVEARFDAAARRFSIRFPRPVAPGNTVTLVIRPWSNPAQSDTYLFQVTAYPAGANPSPAPLGFGTLRIYDPDWR